MIVGIGTDIIEIKRIEELINKNKDELLKRVFTQGEIAYSDSKKRSVQHFAVRFAAKEAVLKALGMGFREVKWQDIEIIKDKLGRPQVHLTGKAREIAEQKNIQHWHLSLSHSDDKAVAFVIAED